MSGQSPGAGRRPLKTRLLLALYSNANIAGCAMALLGPFLLFAGVIGPGWFLITAGLYGVGALVGSSLGRTPELERAIEASLTLEQTMDHLDTLLRDVRPQLTDDMNQRLSSVRVSVAEVLPKLVQARSFSDELFTVRETVLRYLPETLANYVALPPLFRSNHPLKGGKTARQLLTEQLDLLDGKLREIVASVAASDAQALLSNGRFLEAKFRQPDFLSA